MARAGQGTNGKFTRSIETAERDAQAARLRARGLGYKQIAEQLGYEDHTGAYKAVQRALKEIVAEPAEELRALELERLDDMYRRAQAVLERRHVTVSQGRVVRLDDEPLEDDGPVLAALDRLLKIQERRARLLGLDAPTQVQAEVVQVTESDIELRQLIAEAKASNALKEQELRENA